MITSNFKVLRVQIIHLPKYYKSCILWHSALNRNAYFPYVSHNRNSKTNKNKKAIILHCVSCYKQEQFFTLFGYFLSALLNSQEPITDSILLQQTLDRKWKSLLLSLFSIAKWFFFCSQVIVQHASSDLTQT